MSQGYAIEIYFDPALENQVLKACFEDLLPTLQKLENVLRNSAAKQETLALSLSSIGSLPNDNNVLFLVPTSSSSLLQFHLQLCDAMKKDGIEEFHPDLWIPCCPVAEEVPKTRMAEAFAVLRGLKLPVSGYAVEISLVEYPPVHEIFSFGLVEIFDRKMGDAKDAFYVVRRGDVVGVYKSISDVQSLLGSSVNDPSLSVYKGYGLSEEAQKHLSLHGLKNAIYAIDASNVQEDLFGQLVTCPVREPNPSCKPAGTNHSEIRPQDLVGSASASYNNAGQSRAKFNNILQVSASSCILEFDGASKGNPGQAGAGAVLRAADGSVVFRLREGVGIATCNAAEYRGVILGLKYALQKGYKHIRVQGDSKLVCMQVQGLWKTKNPNMAELCKVARELKDQFISFEISHVERAFNAEADAQANLGVLLKAGEIQVECDVKS